MGHRDNVDPAWMAVEGTSFFADVEDQTDSSDVSVIETVDDAPQKPPAGKRRSTVTPPKKGRGRQER